MSASSSHGSQVRKLIAHILHWKHEAEMGNWKQERLWSRKTCPQWHTFPPAKLCPKVFSNIANKIPCVQMSEFVRDISHSNHHWLWVSWTSLLHRRYDVKLSTFSIIDNTETIFLHGDYKLYKDGSIMIKLSWAVDNMKQLHYSSIVVSLHK